MILKFLKDQKKPIIEASILCLILFVGAFLITDAAASKFKKTISEKQGEINQLQKEIDDLQKSNEDLKNKWLLSTHSDSAHFYALEQAQRSNIKNTHNGGIKTANRIIYLSDDSLSQLFSKYNGQ